MLIMMHLKHKEHMRSLSKMKRGFTLLLATLIASLLLILGAAIFEIIKKEIILSSIGRDSQFAFYSADTSAECALYWDIRFDHFGSTTPPATITCDAQTVPVGASGVYSFEYNPNGFCARVDVEKSDTHPRTTIRARGYSVSCANIAGNPRALERAVRIRY